MKLKLCIDSDIILDVLAIRDNFYEPAASLFDLGYEGKIDLCTTAVVLANVFYILRKKHGIEKSKEQIKELRQIMKILPINGKMVDDVLISKISDFEDGLQYFAAKGNNIPIVITRNVKDYKEKDLIIQTADEFIKSVEKKGIRTNAAER
jgi:predicted nucleic acid-binding protein